MSVERVLTPRGFDRLLLELDPDRDAAGRTYEQLRRRLVRFFEGRRCPFPDEYADETLNRVARKLDAGDAIEDVTTYVIGVARMVLKEASRSAAKEISAATSWRGAAQAASFPDATAEETSRLLDCLDGCLSRLSPGDQDLIVRYYEDEKQAKIRNRRLLADGLGVDMNALRLRAFRIRAALESCVDGCAARGGPRNDMGRYASTH